MNCSGCKHWGSKPYEYYDEEGEEAAAPHRICGRITIVQLGQKPEPVQAFVRDGSGYMAELWTEATFGCALFESR